MQAKGKRIENIQHYETPRLILKTATLGSFILKAVHMIISVFNELFLEQKWDRFKTGK